MPKKTAPAGLSSDDIFDQLHGSSSSALVYTGLVKKGDGDQSILLSRGTDSQTFKPIPTSAIEKVQFVRAVQCGGQSYPLAHVFLKEPQTDEGRAFASVAELHRAASATGAALPSAPATSPSPPPGADGKCPDGYTLRYFPDTDDYRCVKDQPW